MKPFVEKKILLVFISVCLLSAAGLLSLYCFDNKYNTGDGSQQLILSGRDWELYPDELLTPREIRDGEYAGIRTFIGQYPNLAGFHEDGDPYGEATWRITFSGEEIPGLAGGDDSTASIQMPEIFCAARIYINGKLVREIGGVDPYRPRIQEVTLSFPVLEENELVVQTANQTHYYGGVYYPPMVGRTEVIARNNAARIIFYGLLAFSSIAVALYSLAIWLSARGAQEGSMHRYCGILAMSFGIRACYPFIHLAGVPGVRVWYALEDGCAFAGIAAVVHLLHEMEPEEKGKRLFRVISGISVGMCAGGVIIPCLLPMLPAFTRGYGIVVSSYKLCMAAWMIISSVRLAAKRKVCSEWALAGTLAFGAGLLASVAWINRYEPIVTGWPEEYGSYVMVFCFAVLMVKRNYILVKEHERLTRHLKEEVSLQTSQITGLVKERQRLLAGFLHDLKSPLSTIYTYVDLISHNQILLDKETKEYMELLRRKCEDINARMRMVQTLTEQEHIIFQMEMIEANGLLRTFYERYLPDVEAAGQNFSLRLPEEPHYVRAEEKKLLRALQNLLYNALSFTPEDGSITLALEAGQGNVSIKIEDTGCGIPKESLADIFDWQYTTRREEGGQGIGLFLVKTLTEEQGGSVTVSSGEGEGSEFVLTFPEVWPD